MLRHTTISLGAVITCLVVAGSCHPGSEPVAPLRADRPSAAVLGNLYTVNTTDDNDDGTCDATHCSLREAITVANSAGGAATIAFALPSTGPDTIQPKSPLPAVSGPVSLDGTTEPDFAGTPVVVLDGDSSGVGSNGDGIVVTGVGATIRGLVIQNFDASGIELRSTSAHTVVAGNYIGVDVSGNTAAPNGYGIAVQSDSNQIGGSTAADRNIVSGNGASGIVVDEYGGTAVGNRVQGNYVGLDATGALPIHNFNGIVLQRADTTLVGGASPGEGNVIGGNAWAGLFVNTDAVRATVQGNLIGTDATGSVRIANGHQAIRIGQPGYPTSGHLIGGTAPGAGNVISSSTFDYGISMHGHDNVVQGNRIGTDVTGTVDFGNSRAGILVAGDRNLIGGAGVGAGNLISGNGEQGVNLMSGGHANVVRGNIIGTDITGTVAIPNSYGISASDSGVVIGGTGTAGNLISGNQNQGLYLTSLVTDATIQGNLIGTDSSGTAALPNGAGGIYIPAGTGTLVGGTNPGEGNVIAFHTRWSGIRVAGSAQASILGNRIFSNVDLGIDLSSDGVTANDAGDGDTGANDLQNFPTLTAAATTGSAVEITGTLASTASATFTVEFFANSACDASGYGQGERFLGRTSVNTDAGGTAAISTTLAAAVSVGEAVTSTATNAAGGTSEFSACVAATAANQLPIADAGGPYVADEGSAVSFDGTASIDPDGGPLSYSWDFGDGNSGSGATPSHTYADNGDFTATLTVTDDEGAPSASASATVTISNVAPIPSADPDPTVDLGVELVFSVGFSDPGVNDASWNWDIDWGDGSAHSTGAATIQGDFTAAHTYTSAGDHTLTFQVTDKDSGLGSLTRTVTVQNQAPTADAGGPYTGDEGSAVSFTGTGSDPDGGTVSYSWDFGDGNSGSGASPSHAYVDNDVYTATLTVTDDEGGSTTSSASVTIGNVNPVPSADPDTTVDLAVELVFTVGFTDPGTADNPWNWDVDWGDGSSHTTGSANSQGTIDVAHTYTSVGPHTLTFQVTDKDGGTASLTRTVTAVNQVPIADPGGPYYGSEGTAVNFDGSASADPDGGPLTYSWDFGDGDTGSGVSPGHAYGDNGGYTVMLTVTDDEGASSVAASATVTINNVVPTIVSITAPSAPQPIGQNIAVDVGFTDPGTLDTHTGLVDWGDGTNSATSVSETNGSGTATGNHAYLQPGVYELALTVTDDDLGSATAPYQYVVAFDPDGGFVTGAGWIDSPSGAYLADPAMVGRASFGFVSRYQRGASVPTGRTDFQFRAADFQFQSTAYDFLVVTQGQRNAQFKGAGTINGALAPDGSEYRFTVWASDSGPDTFRIRIWWEDAGGVETVMYDNGVQQAISGGNIVVQTR